MRISVPAKQFHILAGASPLVDFDLTFACTKLEASLMVERGKVTLTKVGEEDSFSLDVPVKNMSVRYSENTEALVNITIRFPGAGHDG